jgi:hypothetical protein
MQGQTTRPTNTLKNPYLIIWFFFQSFKIILKIWPLETIYMYRFLQLKKSKIKKNWCNFDQNGQNVIITLKNPNLFIWPLFLINNSLKCWPLLPTYIDYPSKSCNKSIQKIITSHYNFKWVYMFDYFTCKFFVPISIQTLLLETFFFNITTTSKKL